MNEHLNLTLLMFDRHITSGITRDYIEQTVRSELREFAMQVGQLGHNPPTQMLIDRTESDIARYHEGKVDAEYVREGIREAFYEIRTS
jgi:hypothetical protein